MSKRVVAESRAGRPPVTTREELAHIGLELFISRGFEETTVDDIAAAAGIARRTFFSYYASKSDLPWGDFDGLVGRMRAHLDAVPDDVDVMDALRNAVIEFNRFPPDQVHHHRLRMKLLLGVPALVARSSLRYESWRAVVAEFVARRLRLPEDALEPQAVAWALLGVSLSAYEQWLRDEAAELPALLDRAYRVVRIDPRGGAE